MRQLTSPRVVGCRKGGRDCVYPAASPTKSSRSRKAPSPLSDHSSPESSSVESDAEDEDADEADGQFDPIPESATSADSLNNASVSSNGNLSPSRTRSSTRKSSETPSLTHDKSPSPSTEGSGTLPILQRTTPALNNTPKSHPADYSSTAGSNGSKLDWSHLPADLQFYLDYHQKHLTAYTYSFRCEGGPFLENTLLRLALHHTPLLYGVVGFAAFQYALTKPDSKLQDFLGYYTTAVSHLRNLLRRTQKHSVATLVTILQLATIEEYLGDWVNLQSHQKAAYEILTELYTPATIMQSDTQRVLFDWYSRFDLFAGLMAGSEMVLSRDWFVAYNEHYQRHSQQLPDDIVGKMDLAISEYRLLAMDMATLFARAKGGGAPEHFMAEVSRLVRDLQAWRADMDPNLAAPANFVTFHGSQALDIGIIDPYEPGLIFERRLWRLNFAMLGWYATEMMMMQQAALMTGQPPPARLEGLARRVCQTIEAVQIWPGSPPGSIFSAQATLAIAALFLPKDERHTRWLRLKFASIESVGYIYPPPFRSKMAKLWNLPEVEKWWLPSDEGYPRIVRSIRSFVEERATQTQPGDSPTSDLKNMKGIFKAMKLNDDTTSSSSKPDSSSSARLAARATGVGASIGSGAAQNIPTARVGAGAGPNAGTGATGQ
ncbi:MAG: hypothetical protein M1838_002725 [Thelocarpon superellum]|nr:MAG: hypothetical protein M1838_002725 [Thelocarpon superellum]